jgi:hypothetical protein
MGKYTIALGYKMGQQRNIKSYPPYHWRLLCMEVSSILDWIFEGIITWIASIVSQIMDAISGIFLNALGTNMLVMEEYFPFVKTAFSILQYMAWCLLFLITVWQLFRAFGGPITEAENPWHLLARSAIFAILIGYAKPLFLLILDIARAPYTALMDSSLDPGSFTFAGIEQTLTNGVTTLLSVMSVVGLLLIIILLICLGWNYFKLLLEVVERYIVVGVLCYTAPLAFSMGASKTTSKVFQSWCRMVGSQLLLLVLNVWFLRAFNSSVGQFVANGGALSSGQGHIFLWMFCALAFLKTAQKFDSYLAAIGLNVAQTGSSMGMEILMAARVLSGVGSPIGKAAGSVFRGGANGAAGAATATGAPVGGGFAAGFASKFKGNSYVRDAVVQGGSKMGAGGSIGFVGRVFGGVAARTGSTLTGESISSVAARHPSVSGSIAGDIANRSLANYMPQLSGMRLSGTQITGGRISTAAVGASGNEASVQMYSAALFEKPDAPHSTVTASDGSVWYQTASGKGMGDFYSAPHFTGDPSEAAQVATAFPDAPEGTMLRSADDGVMEATYPDGGNSMWLNSAHYQEPDAPHDTVTSDSGVSWYAMHPHAESPDFEMSGSGALINNGLNGPDVMGGTLFGNELNESGVGGTLYSNGLNEPGVAGGSLFSNELNEPGVAGGAIFSNELNESGVAHGAVGDTYMQGLPQSQLPGSGGSESFDPMAIAEYNRAQFQQFMPGYEQNVSQINAARKDEGMLEVRHKDGSGTAFYDKTMYQAPRGDYQVYEDNKGGQWYAINGTPSVERSPVYENGKPVYDGEKMKTAEVENVRYKATLTKFGSPQKRDPQDIKPPKRKQ